MTFRGKIFIQNYYIKIAYCFLMIGMSCNAFGLEMTSKLTLVEETDDSFKPGVGFDVVTASGWGCGLLYWGRDFGPVSERRYQGSFYKKMAPFAHKQIFASLGLAVLNESTEIEYPSSVSSYDTSEEEWNGGGFFGIYYKLTSKPGFSAELHWESALYPAGQAAILLVTGRKQNIGLSAGVKF